uniref:Uncharacterized protein n=1 Tax=Ananas comosus var. bracteatus TaxID=296719 RepID=A0A6V7Q6A7_ANACO|nr:unnamed protein product [Ananas comosus var. bracteatus]
MSKVHIFYVRLLHEICEQLQVEVPQFVVSVDAEGKFLAYADVSIQRSGTIVESTRCWSAQSSTSAAAEQDAARLAVKKLVDELDLDVTDANYDRYLLYKGLYDHVTIENVVVVAQYNKLMQDYNLLRDCYVSTVIQKNEYVDDRIKIRRAINECHAVVNRLGPIDPDTESAASGALSAPLD